MEPRVHKLEKTVFGNGTGGLVRDVEGNKISIEDLKNISQTQLTAVNGLLRYQAEEQGREDEREKYRKERQANRKFIIVQSIAIVSILVGVLIWVLSTYVE